MNQINLSTGLDMESFINNVAADAKHGNTEDKKITASRIKIHSEKIQDKRKEQLDNIMEQMKQGGGSGCLKFFKSFFKVFDILLKPISAITMGKFSIEIGGALESLQNALKNKSALGIKIDGEKINKVLEGVKKLFQEDVQRLEQRETINNKETQKIIQMINEIQEGLQTGIR